MEEQMINENIEIKKEKLPKISYIFFGLALFCLIIYLIAIFYTPFADFFNRYISSIFRGILASITNILPLSLSEIFLITLPITLFFIIRYCMNRYSGSWHDVGIFCLAALSVLSLFFSIFILTFGTGYYTSELDVKLELEKSEKISKEELSSTADWLIGEVNARVESIEFIEKSSSVSPYSVREINTILLESYKKLSAKYDFLPRLTSYIKPVMLSKPMTYTHIAGVYTYFTGEANLNTNAPDYSIPYTVAHELAHQRGIAREDEANFIAFLVCVESENEYIQYCGYLNLLEYVLNALYSSDKDLWEETYQKLDNRAIYEMIAYNNFYEPYRDNIVGDISGAVNDAYLQANGTEGTVSYGLVAELAVAYFNKNIEN